MGELLRESDNTTAELLLKEMGRRASGGDAVGTTDAGLAAARTALAGAGLDLTGLDAHDGSGLDRADNATCSLLAGSVAKAGRQSTLAGALPVAGKTGTLTKRFVGTPVEGRLRAKTGTLSGVERAGRLDRPRGPRPPAAGLCGGVQRRPAGPAGHPPRRPGGRGARHLARRPAGGRPVPGGAPGGVARGRHRLAVTGSGVLPMFPLGSVLFPHMPLPLHVFEPRYRALVDHCVAAAERDEPPEFGVVLIERGQRGGRR